MGDHVGVHVECYSGHEYAERPRAIHWEGARLEVVEIENRWRTPEGNAFKVLLEDGRVCVLTFSAPNDDWTIDWSPS